MLDNIVFSLARLARSGVNTILDVVVSGNIATAISSTVRNNVNVLRNIVGDSNNEYTCDLILLESNVGDAAEWTVVCLGFEKNSCDLSN